MRKNEISNFVGIDVKKPFLSCENEHGSETSKMSEWHVQKGKSRTTTGFSTIGELLSGSGLDERS